MILSSKGHHWKLYNLTLSLYHQLDNLNPTYLVDDLFKIDLKESNELSISLFLNHLF